LQSACDMNAQLLLGMACAGACAALLTSACSSPNAGQLAYNDGLPGNGSSSGGSSGGGSGGGSSSGASASSGGSSSGGAARDASAPGDAGAAEAEAGLMVDPNAPITFTLLDTSMTQNVQGTPVPGYDPMPNGITIDESKVSGAALSIRANPKAAMVGSVHFTYDGIYSHTENAAPYTLCADDGKGNVNPCPLGGDGMHWVTATVYSLPDLQGIQGPSEELHFLIAGAPTDAGGQ